MTCLHTALEILADPLPQITMTSLTSASELMSALADGQLRDDELARAWQMLAQSDDAGISWNHYHLIGDALRSPGDLSRWAASADSALFVNRLNVKLHAKEPQQWADGPPTQSSLVALELDTSHNAPHRSQRGTAANDDVFRWKLLAGFASLAAVSVISWSAIGSLSRATVSPQLAQSRDATQVLVASPQGVIVRDARLDELLAAHKQLGSMSALQAPTGFLQSAAFETSLGSGR